jgi:hypothetical protein
VQFPEGSEGKAKGLGKSNRIEYGIDHGVAKDADQPRP